MPALSRHHCFVTILEALAMQSSLLPYRYATIVGGASNTRVVVSP